MNMVNMEHDISFQYFVGFMFYKLVYEIGILMPFKALKIGQL